MLPIHAPTQGATPTVDLAHGHIPVSIHAPTQGATIVHHALEPWWGFNPRTHAGCDYAPHAIPTLMSGFNPRTHAGCDACAAAAAAPTPRFNPRTHAGCDQTDCVVRATPSMFQSTHPRRVRPTLHHSRRRGVPMFQSTHPRRVRRPQHPGGRAGRRFNPRTHAGCDAAQLIGPLTEQEFQSTHPRRVRRWTVRLAAVGVVSIHAPTQCDAPASPGTATPSAFQSTHPRRVRPGIARLAESVEDVSIHAPTQGATSPASPDRWFRWRFNPRTHAGCDRPTR